MQKPSKIETQLAALSRLREEPNSPALRKELQKHLSSKMNLIVAKAAQLATHLGESDLLPELIEAFDRFMVNPAQTDKGCLAKIKLMKGLCARGCQHEDVFIKGIRHVQLEPAYGGPVDTACELRATSALGLVEMGSTQALTELVTLMADKEVEARIGAVRGLAHSEQEAAWLLLRFKVLAGDSEPAVISECFAALMRGWPRKSLRFVGSFVDPAYPSLSEAAALALGESRSPEAFELLKQKWEGTCHPGFRQMLLLPIALIRHEGALDFLLSLVATRDVQTASAAITALAVHQQDPRVRERLRAAVGGSDKVGLLRVFESQFGTDVSSVP
jgi:hypothetical protein